MSSAGCKLGCQCVNLDDKGWDLLNQFAEVYVVFFQIITSTHSRRGVFARCDSKVIEDGRIRSPLAVS